MIPPSSLKLLGGKLCGRRKTFLELKSSILTDELCIVRLAHLASHGVAGHQHDTIDFKETIDNGISFFVINVLVFTDAGGNSIYFHHTDDSFTGVGSGGLLIGVNLARSLAALQIIDQFAVIK